MGQRLRHIAALARRRALAAPRAARRFLRLPWRDQLTTLRVLAWFVVVEAAVRLVKLPRLARLLGVRVDGSPTMSDEPGGTGRAATPSPRRAVALGHTERIARARRCTLRVARRWPFGRGPCLRESLVLGHLVREHDPVLRMGVRRRGTELQAHAWVEVDGEAVSDPHGHEPFIPADWAHRAD